MILFAIVAFIAYILSIIFVIPRLLGGKNYHKWIVICAVVALITHAISLHSLFTDPQINLLNIISCISFFICLIMTIVAFTQRGWLLLPIVYGLAIVCIILASFISLSLRTSLTSNGLLLAHIIIAMFSYATLLISALYSLQFAICNYQLKHKTLPFNNTMPPLMKIEKSVLHLTLIGFILLTITFIFGFFYIEDWGRNQDKIIFSVIAWLFYIVLFWCHYQRHWRGLKIVWLNLFAICLLSVGYLGTRIFSLLH